MAIKTYSFCLAPTIKGEAENLAAKVAEFLQADKAAESGVGDSDSFRFTFRRVGRNQATLRIYPHYLNHEFSGEAYASW